MIMSEDARLEKQPRELIDAKITMLRQNAFALLQEIKELGSLSFAEVGNGIDLYSEMRRFEIKLIHRALEATDGHQVNAARLLGLNVTTLNAKIKRYGIDPHDMPNDGEALSRSE